jgi:hypothetical protein
VQVVVEVVFIIVALVNQEDQVQEVMELALYVQQLGQEIHHP